MGMVVEVKDAVNSVVGKSLKAANTVVIPNNQVEAVGINVVHIKTGLGRQIKVKG